MLHIVLLAGGQGSRLAPLSDQNIPKQFHKIWGDKSLIQHSFHRLKSFDVLGLFKIWISTTESYKKLVLEQIVISPDQIIAEPAGKNTLPGLAFISHYLAKIDTQANIITLASDQYYTPESLEAIITSLFLARNFLIKHPQIFLTAAFNSKQISDQFGYVLPSKVLSQNIFQIKRFIEKPNMDEARLLIQNNALINACIFIFQANYFNQHIQQLYPEIDGAIKDYYLGNKQPFKDLVPLSFEKELLPKLPNKAVLSIGDQNHDFLDLGKWENITKLLFQQDLLFQENQDQAKRRGIQLAKNSNCLYFFKAGWNKKLCEDKVQNFQNKIMIISNKIVALPLPKF